jgi:hypothetical protein
MIASGDAPVRTGPSGTQSVAALLNSSPINSSPIVAFRRGKKRQLLRKSLETRETGLEASQKSDTRPRLE